MESNLSQNALKNASFSLFGYLAPIVFSILITPILIRKMGGEQYGIFLLLNSINGFLSLMDLGYGMALVKYAAEYHAVEDYEKLQKLVLTSNTIFFLAGLIGLLVYFCFGFYFLDFFHISDLSHNVAKQSFVIFGGIFLFTSLSYSYSYLIKSIQRYDIVVTIGFVQNLIIALGSLLLVLKGYGLVQIMYLYFFVTLAAMSTLMFFVKNLISNVSLFFGWNSEQVAQSFKFGIGAFTSNISGAALLYLDRLIIPIYSNPQALTFYSMPGNVAQKSIGITGSLSGILFPMLSSLTAQGLADKTKQVYLRVFRNTALLSLAMTLPMFIFAHEILFYWLGPEFAQNGTDVLKILAATYFILGIFGTLINFLMGMGEVKLLSKFSFFMLVLNMAFLFLLLPKYKIIGAAWAYFLAVLPAVYLFYYVETKILKIEGIKLFYLKLYSKLFVNSLLFWAISLFLRTLITNFASLVVVGGCSVGLFLLTYKLLGFFETEDWNLYINFLKLIKNKLFYGTNLIKN